MAHVRNNEPRLVSQPSKKPTRKITAGATAGVPLAIVIGWGAGHLGLDIPDEVSIALASLIGSLGSAVVGYFTHERNSPRKVGT